MARFCELKKSLAGLKRPPAFCFWIYKIADHNKCPMKLAIFYDSDSMAGTVALKQVAFGLTNKIVRFPNKFIVRGVA
jgi:hypothetical protein